MNCDIERLYREIALGIYAAKPSAKWVKGIFHFEGIRTMNKANCTFLLEDGSKFSANMGFDVDDMFAELRTKMAALHEKKHAWYTAKCEVRSEGKFIFDFDYDRLPALDIIPSPSQWLDEFKHHPRPEFQEKIQDWIDQKINSDEIVKRLSALHQD